MLDKIRENSRSPLTFVIFGAIIVVFIAYFGPASSGCTGSMGAGADAGPGAYAAKVNGKEISGREFDSAYQAYYRSYQQQMGAQFTPELAEQLKLKDQVLDRLVERRLLVELAKSHGLAVSDAEVAETIKEIPGFQKDGHFDFDTYKQALEFSLGISPEKFEQEVRDDLLKDKMLAQVRQGAKVADDEVEAEFARDNDKASLSYVRFTVPMFRTQAAPTDDEVKSFLATEAGKKAVEEEYKKKIFRFKKPKRVKAQHILVKVAEDAPQADVDAAKAKLEDAKKKLEGGADFGALAKELSEDPGSKDKGGDLGFFGPGTMAKPFEEAAMALAPGQLSDVVRTRFGLHLIKVNDVQQAEEKPLAEVENELARELVAGDKSKLVAKQAAEAALAQIKTGQELKALYPPPATEEEKEAGANQNKPIAEETGLFAVGSEYVPRVGVSAELSRAAAAAKTVGEALPQVYEVAGAFVIAQLLERKVPDAAELDKRRAEFRDRVLRRKEQALVETFTKKLRDGATIETNPTIFADAASAGATDAG